MKTQILLAITLSLFSTITMAHSGAFSSLPNAFLHPLIGWDHLLMLLSIGIWAAQLNKSHRYLLTTILIGFIGFGIYLGLNALSSISDIHYIVQASIIVMGVLLLAKLPASTFLRINIVAIVALLHGISHGMEQHTNIANSTLLGIILSTSLLYYIGLIIGFQRQHFSKYFSMGLGALMIALGGFSLLH